MASLARLEDTSESRGRASDIVALARFHQSLEIGMERLVQRFERLETVRVAWRPVGPISKRGRRDLPGGVHAMEVVLDGAHG